MKSRPARGKIELRFYPSFRDSGEKCSRSPFSMQPHEHLGSKFVVDVCCRNSGVEVVKDEGAEARVRCLHFVLALAELGLAPKVLIKSRDLA